MKIKAVKAREILDSRGNPTIETEVFLETGETGIASIPTGLSTGKHEAVELRDKDPNRFNGLGVLKAVANVNKIIAPKVIGQDAAYQGKIDQLLINLDGTSNKSKLGANAILSVSQAVLEASAASYKIPIYRYLESKYQLSNPQTPLPIPIFNLINGGKHGNGNLDFQEFHIIPSSRKNYHEALACSRQIHQNLKKNLNYRGANYGVGAEGGFTPKLFTNMDALEILIEAIKSSGYETNRDIFLGLDVSANFFYKNNQYSIRDRSQPFDRKSLIQYYVHLNNEYHLFSLEDPLFEDDWTGWAELNNIIGNSTLIVGDDLLASNKERVQKAIAKKVCSAILIKPNQIGTISETIEVIKLARTASWKIIVSHRSGETNDDFIADFAIGVGADYTKFGAPAQGERIAKYNRLLKIEEEKFKSVL